MKLIELWDFKYFSRYFIPSVKPGKVGAFFAGHKLKLWGVEISIVSCVIPRNLSTLTILVPEALNALLMDYFVSHDR